MKKGLVLFLMLISGIYCTCAGDGGDLIAIDGITAENYPRVDGSTSVEPLNTLIACKLLGYRYQWRQLMEGNGTWKLEPNKEDIPDNLFGEKIKISQTHNAIINLIDNRTDIIISARQMSPDERDYAESIGVSLIETPIALDALDFIVNKNNSVNTLTVKQIQDIYLGNITNWENVGGAEDIIKPFIRNDNSGSQEMMNEIVMKNVDVPDWEKAYPYDDIITTMSVVYRELSLHKNGICFTPHYYREYIVREDAVGAVFVKPIAINGVMSSQNSIKIGTYPFVADVYVAIRSDLAHNTTAYRIYEWLQTPPGQAVISESGYVPKFTTEVNSVGADDFGIFPNPVSDGFRITGLKGQARLMIYSPAGIKILSKTISDGEFVDIADLQAGLYIAILFDSSNNKTASNKIIKI
ncbi:MAG: substrate-binding domain-containing protein [Dysgonamonadaceae bacterium]|jgi:phosphate transport system substrate-binding protein|nr:substrate-binding domain-containing protein [Dysgonamonadaceae bacterium]